jgi:hypothetical protein
LITHKDNEIEPPSFELLGALETMIGTYNLSGAERRRFKRLLQKCGSQEMALEIMALMQNFRPIMGLERIPQDMREINEAVKNRMEIEDFKDRWKE